MPYRKPGSGGPRRKQRVRRRATRTLAIELGFAASDLLAQGPDPLLELDNAVELEILSHEFRQPLAAGDANFSRFFHSSRASPLRAP
jgi:hypothetical protein